MKLVKALRKQGFTVQRTGSGHWLVSNDNKFDGVVILGFSPRTAGLAKAVKRLKAMGYKP
jgi:biotin operon repressor